MTYGSDFSTFSSRLHITGTLTFQTGMRIGAERSLSVTSPDLPILRDALGHPYIPGSSLKGILRSTIEATLRALQLHPEVKDRNLACLSVGKEPRRPKNAAQPHICLHQDEVTTIKQIPPSEWMRSKQISPALRQRLESLNFSSTDSDEARRDIALIALSCHTCRVFGAPWLAGRVSFRDLPLREADLWPVNIRDGVAINRDAGRAEQGQKYQMEALAPGAEFEFEMLVENASEADLGLLWLGINALERGEVPIGGGRARGLGWAKLALDWQTSRYVTENNLLDAIFPSEETSESDFALPADIPAIWAQAFRQAITREKAI